MDKIDVHTYIPQRPPFVMIDELLQADEGFTKTSFTIKQENIFSENGFFTEAGLVENMAQTAAAGTGFRASEDGKSAPVGFIGALKNLRIDELPETGTTITTEIRFLHQVMNAHIAEGKIFTEKGVIANCELKIFLQDS